MNKVIHITVNMNHLLNDFFNDKHILHVLNADIPRSTNVLLDDILYLTGDI